LLNFVRLLIAQLHLDSLIGKTTPNDIQASVRNLQVGSEAVTQLYEETMERIEKQRQGIRELAHKVLAWINCTYTTRLLTPLELQHALAVKAGGNDLDKNNIPMIQDIFSGCAGLVMREPDTNTICFAHSTIHEYFKQTRKNWLAKAENDIAETCITYLSFDAFESGICDTDVDLQARLQQYPFYRYAAKYWVDHYRAAPTDLDQPTLALLENKAKVSALYQAMKADSGCIPKMPEYITALDFAAQLGLAKLTMKLLANQHDPNSMDSNNRTPLWLAIEMQNKDGKDEKRQNDDGQNEEVIELLAKGDRITFRMMMLKKKRDMIKSLLKIAYNDIRDFRRRTPIHIAIELDDLETAREAILSGVNIDAKDSDGVTSLLLAVGLKKKGKDFVDLLLENGADAKGVNRKDWIEVYGTPETEIVQVSELWKDKKPKSVDCFPPRKFDPPVQPDAKVELVHPSMQPDVERRLVYVIPFLITLK